MFLAYKMAHSPSSFNNQFGPDQLALYSEPVNLSCKMAAESVHFGNGKSNVQGGSPVSSPTDFSVDTQKRKKPEGRPQKVLAMEQLLECKGYTLEAAAEKLEVSSSTLKRRLKEHTGETWSKLQQSRSVSQRVHEKRRMQDMVEVVVEYGPRKIPFDVPSTEKLGRFQQLIKDSLKLEVGTYDIKYNNDFSIVCNTSLRFCFSRAPIVLKIEDVVKRI